MAFGAVVGGALFGGVHCLAWNFRFPPSDERLAWRICSVLTAGLPPLSIVPLGFWIGLNPFYSGGARDPESEQALPDTRRDGHSFSPKIIFVGLTLVTGFLAPYLLARLFLMVEIFRSLFFLPPDAFINTWPGSFPHWG